MAEIVTLRNGHPLVGTWRDGDKEFGSSVELTILPSGNSFQVLAVDTSDGEELSISSVRWNGQTLSFESLVGSNGHRAKYVLEVLSPSEVLVQYTTSERWIRADSTP